MDKLAGEKLVQIMQMAALGAVDNKVMANVLLGRVTDAKKLTIWVETGLELTKEYLIRPKHLTDYKVTLETTPEQGITSTAASHTHTYEKYATSKEYTVKNALKVGDKVALLRAIGGQKYYILDRVVSE